MNDCEQILNHKIITNLQLEHLTLKQHVEKIVEQMEPIWFKSKVVEKDKGNLKVKNNNVFEAGC